MLDVYILSGLLGVGISYYSFNDFLREKGEQLKIEVEEQKKKKLLEKSEAKK